jgi:hypothetical protein
MLLVRICAGGAGLTSVPTATQREVLHSVGYSGAGSGCRRRCRVMRVWIVRDLSYPFLFQGLEYDSATGLYLSLVKT